MVKQLKTLVIETVVMEVCTGAIGDCSIGGGSCLGGYSITGTVYVVAALVLLG